MRGEHGSLGGMCLMLKSEDSVYRKLMEYQNFQIDRAPGTI